nr:hypothetical protein [uncultured Bacteroides sp.]
MAENYWRIMLQTPACNFQKPAGVCSTSGYVFKKAGGMFFITFLHVLREKLKPSITPSPFFVTYLKTAYYLVMVAF